MISTLRFPRIPATERTDVKIEQTDISERGSYDECEQRFYSDRCTGCVERERDTQLLNIHFRTGESRHALELLARKKTT